MQKNYGFTLVEALIATIIITILGFGIVGLRYILAQNELLIWKNYLSVDQANSQVTTMVREIRNAREGDNGSYYLVTAADQGITFYSDIDHDAQSEKVRYYLDGTSLYKGVIEPEGFPVNYPSGNERLIELTENIRNAADPIFYYLNGDWPDDTQNNPLPSGNRLSNTRLVRINLILNTDPDDPKSNYVLESYAQIRMLKDNL